MLKKLLLNNWVFRATVFILIITGLWLFARIWAEESMRNPSSFSFNLKYINPQAMIICEDAEKMAGFRKGEIKFYVSLNFYTIVSGVRAYVVVENNKAAKEVYLHPEILNASNLKHIIIHELGHIKNQNNNQGSANEFAAKLLGMNMDEFSAALRKDRPFPRLYLAKLYSGAITIQLDF